MKEESGTTNKVGERVSFLVGRKVCVRVAYGELGQLGSEEFTATYKDTYPMGREYFFCFVCGGRHKLVRASSVVEITELPES